jgi:hypothetical protein
VEPWQGIEDVPPAQSGPLPLMTAQRRGR